MDIDKAQAALASMRLVHAELRAAELDREDRSQLIIEAAEALIGHEIAIRVPIAIGDPVSIATYGSLKTSAVTLHSVGPKWITTVSGTADRTVRWRRDHGQRDGGTGMSSIETDDLVRINKCFPVRGGK